MRLRSLATLLASFVFVTTTARAVVVGPEAAVTPPVYGSALGAQTTPVVASDGNEFLTAWTSERGIAIARVSNTGEVLTVPSRTVVTAEQPAGLNLVFGATQYLMVWRATGRNELYAAAVTRDGAVGTPHLIASGGTLVPHALAWNGQNFLLAWQTLGAVTHTTLLAADGSVIREATIASQPFGGEPHAIAIGDTFLVVQRLEQQAFIGFGFDSVFSGVRVGPDGTPERPQMTQMFTRTNVSAWDLASNGVQGVLVTSEYNGKETVHSRLILPTLEPKDDWTIPGRADASTYISGVTVQSNGLTFLATWTEPRASTALFSQFLDANARPVRDVVPLCCSGANAQPALAYNGRNWLAVWHDRTPPARIDQAWNDPGDVHGALLDGLGQSVVGSERLLSTTARLQSSPALATNGRTSFAAWIEATTDATTDLYVARVGAAGAETTPLRISDSPSQASPAVVWTGNGWLVAWADRRGDAFNATASPIAIRRFAPDGTPRDTAPTFLTTTSAYAADPALAFDGASVLAVWHYSGGAIYGIRLTVDGTPLDPAPFAVAANALATEVDVATNGSEFLVVWSDGIRSCPLSVVGCAQRQDILGARVSRSGALLDPKPLAIAATDAWEMSPSVASDGRDFAVVYSAGAQQFDRSSVDVARVLANGNVIGRTTVAGDAATNYVDIARRDGGYTVAYAFIAVDGAHTTLHVAHVEDGEVSGDTVVQAAGGAGMLLALADDDPRMLYTRLADEPQYGGVYRLFIRTVGAGRARAVSH